MKADWTLDRYLDFTRKWFFTAYYLRRCKEFPEELTREEAAESVSLAHEYYYDVEHFLGVPEEDVAKVDFNPFGTTDAQPLTGQQFEVALEEKERLRPKLWDLGVDIDEEIQTVPLGRLELDQISSDCIWFDLSKAQALIH
jgi:hypothetical protein